MVGFVSKTTIDKDDQNKQHSKPKEKLDSFDPNLIDLSLADSFVDFGSIEYFFREDNQIDLIEDFPMEVFDKVSQLQTHVNDETVDDSCYVLTDSKPVVGTSNDSMTIDNVSASGTKIVEERLDLDDDEGNQDCSIEGEMDRVNIHGLSRPGYIVGSVVRGESTVEDSKVLAGSSSVITCNDGKATTNDNNSRSYSESETESSASSTDCSEESDDEEDENRDVTSEVKEREAKKVEISDCSGEEMAHGREDEDEEDGEIVEWSDVEFEDEDDGSAPINSRAEHEVLPPVPHVDVTLEAHHQMLPVGVVLSIVGIRIIVEGLEKHSPLNEGSVLWITERRSPLGLVDEIFGPVKHPYYVVRYNSENELPADITEGALISFVVKFANHVLNDRCLYNKGYDASGENDEELLDQLEFSDDDKEAEYRRMQAMSKCSLNDMAAGKKMKNKRKVKGRNRKWKNREPVGQNTTSGLSAMPVSQHQHNVPPNVPSTSYVNSLVCTSIGQDTTGGAGFGTRPPPMAQMSNFFHPLGHETPFQLPLNPIIPGGFPLNVMPWPAQKQFRPLNQLHPNTGHQLFLPHVTSFPTAALPGNQLFAGPSTPPLLLGQGCFNQNTLGMGYQVQTGLTGLNTANIDNPGVIPSGPPMMNNYNLQLPTAFPSTIMPGEQSNVFTNLTSQGTGYQVWPAQFNNNATNLASQGITFGQPPLQHNYSLQSPVVHGQFHLGASSSRGRKPQHRGGGRFAGGRGQPS